VHRRLPVRALAVVVLALALTIGAAAPAFAASIWRGIGVELYDLQADKEPTLVIYGTFVEGTEFPADIELPIPKGSQVSWFGQLTGDPTTDEMVPITLRQEDDYDVIVATVKDGRPVQADLTVPEGWVTRTSSSLEIAMKWTPIADLVGARLGFEIPAAYHAENLDPDTTVGGKTETGVMYTSETADVEAGQTLTLSGTIIRGADTELFPEGSVESSDTTAAPVETPGTPEPVKEPIPASTMWLVGLLVLVAVLVGVLAWAINRQGGLTAAAVEDDAADTGQIADVESDDAGTADDDWGTIDDE